VGGLVFFLIGLIVATDSSDIASVLIGLAVGGLGLGFAYGGARTGVFMTQRGLTVREFFAVESYATESLRSLGIGEHEHETVPLMLVFPVIRLRDRDVALSCLATYRFLPGASRQATRAAETMAKWTDKPVT
jgi:hypothetical protein